MKRMREKRYSQRGSNSSWAWKNQAGYVCVWVIMLMVVSSLVITPFLTYMLVGVRASYSHTDTMSEFYAADSGIEDGLYKLQYDYSASSPLGDDIDSSDDIIEVQSTALFPERGVIQIESELIKYTGKSDTDFTGCQRGYDGTTASNHDNGLAVTATLPTGDVGDTWEYGIEDINGKQVDITIENVWSLDGLEDDSTGTTPHSELVVVGQMLDIVATALTGEIDDTDEEIPVSSTASFPAADADNPRTIRIGDELIQYTGKTATEFTGCIRGADATSHEPNTAVTLNEITYQIDVTDESPGGRKVERIGAWLPAGFSYVPGSSNVASELAEPIFDTTVDIELESVDRFPSPGVEPGVTAIGDDLTQVVELVPYENINRGQNELQDCQRGPDAQNYPSETKVSAEPVQADHHGGTAIVWNFDQTPFEELPRAVPLGGGSQPREEFPMKRTITFRFIPDVEPRGIFSWIRIQSEDVSLSWDTSGGNFKITSVATDPVTGTSTAIESYAGLSRLRGRTTQVYGDARAIGNSLMRNLSGDSKIRETLLDESSAFIDVDHDNEIPENATVEAAYLYWSAWKLNPAYDGDDIDDMAELVDGAEFNGTPITADRVQIMENQYGWSYSSFKDVTDLLEPPQSADITINPVIGSQQSVTIYDEGGGALDIQVTADNDNPDDMTIDIGGSVTAISPGVTRNVSISDPETGVLSSGTTTGIYTAIIEGRNNSDIGRVDGDGVDNERFYGYKQGQTPHLINVNLETSASESPQATITTLATDAYVNITNTMPTGDPDNEIIVDGITIEPGDTLFDHWLNGADPDDSIQGVADDRSYDITITCTDGMVTIEYGSNIINIGEPGSQTTNGEYTVGYVAADVGVEGGGSQYEWAYAAWSLILIYSHLDEDARQLFLYDDFTYIDSNADNFPAGYLEFGITGFRAPEDFEGILTCFVGEGDPNYTGEYIEMNGERLPCTDIPYDDPYDEPDGLNPQNNVWNGISSVPGIEGSGEGAGIDIDAFWIEEPVINEGDTAATLKMDSGVDIWNIVYIFLSIRTDPNEETLEKPVSIISFGRIGG
jgi:hypothetical protein